MKRTTTCELSMVRRSSDEIGPLPTTLTVSDWLPVFPLRRKRTKSPRVCTAPVPLPCGMSTRSTPRTTRTRHVLVIHALVAFCRASDGCITCNASTLIAGAPGGVAAADDPMQASVWDLNRPGEPQTLWLDHSGGAHGSLRRVAPAAKHRQGRAATAPSWPEQHLRGGSLNTRAALRQRAARHRPPNSWRGSEPRHRRRYPSASSGVGRHNGH